MISVQRLNHRAAKRKHLHGTLPTAAVSKEPLKQTMPLSQSNRWWDMSRGGRLCVETIAGPLQHSTELSSGCGGQMCVKGSARRRRAPGYEQRGSRGKSDRKSGKMEKKREEKEAKGKTNESCLYVGIFGERDRSGKSRLEGEERAAKRNARRRRPCESRPNSAPWWRCALEPRGPRRDCLGTLVPKVMPPACFHGNYKEHGDAFR